MNSKLHYRLAEVIQHLGPGNFFVRAVLRRICRDVELSFCDGHIDVARSGKVIRVSSRHLAYLGDIAGSFEQFFNEVEPFTEEGFQVVDYSQPRLHRYRDSGLEFEFSSFAEEVGALNDYFRWHTPAPGDTVFDAGAYCGASVYHLAQLVGQNGKVVAFEPDPLNYSILERNISRHGLTNVVTVQSALADRSGDMKFFAEGALGSTIAEHSSRGSSVQAVTVKTVSFEDACACYGVPSFVKVDIEGAEIAMLAAAADFLRKQRIHFALDTNHRVAGRLTFGQVEKIFRSVGYRAESSAASGFMTTWASPA